MSIENPRVENDLRNLEVIEKILVSGTDAELESLRDFHHLSVEKIQLFRYFMRMRNDVHEKMQEELKVRETTDPVATEEELGAGVYRENLEPQVRDAVFLLRGKGYPTQESGFYGPEGQRITFAADFNLKYKFSSEFIEQLQLAGLELKMIDGDIALIYQREVSLDFLKSTWDQITALLPDLGKPAEPSMISNTENFREVQEKLK